MARERLTGDRCYFHFHLLFICICISKLPNRSELSFSTLLSQLLYCWDWLWLWTVAATVKSDYDYEAWFSYCHCFRCCHGVAVVAMSLLLLPCRCLIKTIRKQYPQWIERYCVIASDQKVKLWSARIALSSGWQREQNKAEDTATYQERHGPYIAVNAYRL